MHWKNRHFTVPELKRLQTFPDGYMIVGSYGKIVEQIGNSVPPLVAEVIAGSVKEQLLRPRKALTYARRPQGFKSSFRQRQRDRSDHFKCVAAKVIAERFPNVQQLEPKRVREKTKYFVSYEGFFTKETSTRRAGDFKIGASNYSVEERRDGDQLNLRIDTSRSVKLRARQLQIEITGLTKYLLNLERVTCTAHLSAVEDVFHVWDIIEDAVTKGTQFYTLIDIYGHYANRGDTVRVQTQVDSKRRTILDRALEFFGTSENSGTFVSQSAIASALKVSVDDIADIVSRLRALRWDVRTPKTHLTIRQNAILCTYPFPLLSGKAQLERSFSAGQ
jgi:DNA (cytosine-5)-methyltransferase 1